MDYEISSNTYNRLIAHIDKSLKHDFEEIKLLEILIEQLQSYEGRVLNIRIENYINIDGCKVRFHKADYYYQIYLYKEEKSFYFTLARSNKKEKNFRFHVSFLVDNLKSYKEKYEKNLIESQNLSTYVSKYNVALKLFKEAQNDLSKLPNWYGFSRYY